MVEISHYMPLLVRRLPRGSESARVRRGHFQPRRLRRFSASEVPRDADDADEFAGVPPVR